MVLYGTNISPDQGNGKKPMQDYKKKIFFRELCLIKTKQKINNQQAPMSYISSCVFNAFALVK